MPIRRGLSLYLLRHGETEFSRSDRFCGHIDAPLTDSGHDMATQFAVAYADVAWRAIVTSTRSRTFETARPIATRAGISIERDTRLDEMSYGGWQGLSKNEAAARDPARFARWAREPTIGPPDGESPFAVAWRAAAVLADLRARHESGNVLLVSHKTVLRILLCGLLGIELRQYRTRFACPVAGLSLIELGSPGPSVRLIDDLSHLPPTLHPDARPAPSDDRPTMDAGGSTDEGRAMDDQLPIDGGLAAAL